MLECLIASLLNAFWDKCREQCFQNSTCENKLTAERKQGFARKFTRFQHLHILSLIVRPMYLKVRSSLVFQPSLSSIFVSKLRFPLVLTWCLFAESPTTIKCHLSPFYVPLFCNSSKQNLSYKWSRDIFHQFCHWPKLAPCNISSM